MYIYVNLLGTYCRYGKKDFLDKKEMSAIRQFFPGVNFIKAPWGGLHKG